ncbi:hypothetical protein GDO86_017752 [Hymenochirus boettgeri]|uniref:Olfactory receptor n=1 Tax=Hymenochirus boettgeri TaxID=247094 RepID=A0A8T2IP46_9PIPI|nr:hypothetical protein GDO86_017752 [Hymenochirus boettgeri]
MENQTVNVLVLSELSDNPSLQFLMFLVFLLVYLMTLTGNLLIVLLICTDSHLQTPMYFFLGTLACLDMSCSSVTIPRMLFDLYTRQKIISMQDCITQIYFFLFLAMSEVVLLAVMSYDRYVAICRPLHYLQIMHWKACVLLVSGVFGFGIVYALVHTLFLLKLTFCSSNTLQSFFCDFPQFIKVSCSDTFINKLLIIFFGLLPGIVFLTLTLYPYIIILNTVMKIPSKHMRSKAFSTCSSHLTVVIIFYGTVFFNYLDTNSKDHFKEGSIVFSVFYAVLAPLFNPLIYSLRNKELKTSLQIVFNKIIKNDHSTQLDK